MSVSIFKKWTSAVLYLNEKIKANRLIAGRNIQLENTGNGIRIHTSAENSSSNDTYKGYFKVIKTADNKLKIVDGMDEEAANCGYVQCNRLAAQAVAVQELTITQNCYIFRKSAGTYTSGVLSSATVSFELRTSFPTYTAGTEYELLSVVTFADGKITDFSNMPLPYRVDITGVCS